MIGFILGIFTASQLPFLVSLVFCLSFILVILLVYGAKSVIWVTRPLGFSRLGQRHVKGLDHSFGASHFSLRALLYATICWGMGFTWFTVSADRLLQSRLPQAHTGDWVVEGRVIGLPSHETDLIRFNLRVNNVISAPEGVKLKDANFERIRLRWFKSDVSVLPGATFTIVTKLKPPHSLANPYGFDYERWALIKGIDATGYVKKHLDYQPPDISVSLIRFKLAHWLTELWSDSPLIAASYRALLLGDRGGLSDDHWALMEQTGTSHLLVVSGLHIGICVWCGWWIGRCLVACTYLGLRLGDKGGLVWPWLERVLPVFFALVLSGIYVGLAGFSLPTQRAWIMAAVLLGGLLLKCPPSVWRRWWFAMFLVLLLNPLSIYEVGFWLSFGAVGALLLLIARRSQSSGIKTAIRAQIWITIVMLPLVTLSFGQVSILSPFVNLLAIPYILLILLLSVPALLCAYCGWTLPLIMVGNLLSVFWSVLDAVVSATVNILGNSSIYLILAPSYWALFSLLVGIFLLLQSVKGRLRWVGVLCCLPAFLPQQERMNKGQFSAVVFDVGQGNAVLISTQNHRLLYDTGARYRSGGSAFESAVLPALSKLSPSANGFLIDELVVSHADNDHAGGLQAIYDHGISFDRLTGGSPRHLLEFPINTYQQCQEQTAWEWDGVSFRYLVAPSQRQTSVTNNQSCVLEIRSSSCSFLLTGDIDEGVEQELSSQLKPVEWLLAGHHGSRHSTGEFLLASTTPKTVVFSAGFLNRYGHPHQDVLSRVLSYTDNVLRTDQDGAVFLYETLNGRCESETWRTRQKRFWSKG